MARLIYLALIIISGLIISSILLQTGHAWLIFIPVLFAVFSIFMLLRAMPESPSLQDPRSRTSRYLGWFYLVGAAAMIFLIDWRHPFQQKTVIALVAAAFLVFARFRLARPRPTEQDEEDEE